MSVPQPHQEPNPRGKAALDDAVRERLRRLFFAQPFDHRFNRLAPYIEAIIGEPYTAAMLDTALKPDGQPRRENSAKLDRFFAIMDGGNAPPMPQPQLPPPPASPQPQRPQAPAPPLSLDEPDLPPLFALCRAFGRVPFLVQEIRLDNGASSKAKLLAEQIGHDLDMRK